jgi:hypothetical protein
MLIRARTQVVAIAHWTTLFLALHHGFGRSGIAVSDRQSTFVNQVGHARERLPKIRADRVRFVKMLFVSQLLPWVCNGLTKCTVALFIRQLIPPRNNISRNVCTITTTIMAGWTAAAPVSICSVMPLKQFIATTGRGNGAEAASQLV